MYLLLLLMKWWRKTLMMKEIILLVMWSVALFILSALLRYSLDRRARRHLMEACVQQRQAGKLWRLPCSPDTTGWENLTLLFTVAFSLPSVHSALYATLTLCPLSLPPVSLSHPTPCFNFWPCMCQHDFSEGSLVPPAGFFLPPPHSPVMPLMLLLKWLLLHTSESYEYVNTWCVEWWYRTEQCKLLTLWLAKLCQSV